MVEVESTFLDPLADVTHMRIFSVLSLASKRMDYLRELIRKANSKNQTNLRACFHIGEQEATQQYYVNCVLRGAQVREPGRFCLCLAK